MKEKKVIEGFKLYILSSFMTLNISDKYKYKWPKPDIFLLTNKYGPQTNRNLWIPGKYLWRKHRGEQIPVCYTEFLDMWHF